jgi:hypothetical protein
MTHHLAGAPIWTLENEVRLGGQDWAS